MARIASLVNLLYETAEVKSDIVLLISMVILTGFSVGKNIMTAKKNALILIMFSRMIVMIFLILGSFIFIPRLIMSHQCHHKL